MPAHPLSDLLARRDSRQLIRTAQGLEPADRVILHGNLINVYTGEIQEDCAVGIRGEWIAGVGEPVVGMIGEKTDVIDAAGRTILPGFIEGHTHLCSMIHPAGFLPYAMKSGTTTIITETLEAYPVAGREGVEDFMKSLSDQPVKVWFTAPAMASISSASRGISEEDIAFLLGRPEVIGLGESYWQAVLQEPDRFVPIFDQMLGAGKLLEGHSAGANAKKLAAYVAAGISSCHEPITMDEALSRLRQGLYVMIREGSIRRDLAAISRIRETGVSLRRLILTTDGVTPEDLITKGTMEYVVQKAVDAGFNPVDAVRMATLNPAEHFGLDPVIGGIAPGRQADMILIPRPELIRPEMVLSRGRIILENGILRAEPRFHDFSSSSRNTILLTSDLAPLDFEVPVNTRDPETTVRVIELVTDLVTRETRLTLPVHNGQVLPASDRNIIKVAAVDRTHRPGKTAVGFLQGFGLQSGSFACSAAWDSSDIIAVGTNDRDLALAINRIRRIQGGAVVCNNEQVLFELPMPVFGIMSLKTAEETAADQHALTEVLRGLGVKFRDPLLTLVTLTGAAIPYLRICEEGLVHLKTGENLDVIV